MAQQHSSDDPLRRQRVEIENLGDILGSDCRSRSPEPSPWKVKDPPTRIEVRRGLEWWQEKEATEETKNE